MKKHLKLIFCVLAGILLMSAVCKAQGSSKVKKVIDSLKITDADEVKVCILYDDVITEYLTQLQDWSSGKVKLTSAQGAEINKKFQQRSKEIQPNIEALRKRLASNYPELMKFVQFVTYETTRVYGGTSQYQKMMSKMYSAPGNH